LGPGGRAGQSSTLASGKGEETSEPWMLAYAHMPVSCSARKASIQRQHGATRPGALRSETTGDSSQGVERVSGYIVRSRATEAGRRGSFDDPDWSDGAKRTSVWAGLGRTRTSRRGGSGRFYPALCHCQCGAGMSAANESPYVFPIKQGATAPFKSRSKSLWLYVQLLTLQMSVRFATSALPMAIEGH